MSKRAIFIGRWTPFHEGHLAIMKKKIDEGKPLLILVRDTHYDIYPARLRKRMIEATMSRMKIDAKVMIIDDIESVNYGRGVGYEVNEIQVPEEVKKISATKIREMISKGDNTWKKFIPDGADKVLENYLTEKGVVVWFTGLPKSGKSTIAGLVSYKLEQFGIKSQRLDSKFLRSTISKDLGFTRKDRDMNIERAAFVSKLLSRNGAIVLSSFISPYNDERQKIRTEIEKEASFVEVYVESSVDACKKRDDEKIYEKAEAGEIKEFTGISAPYEMPNNPEIVVNTEKKNMGECADKIVEYLLSMIQ